MSTVTAPAAAAAVPAAAAAPVTAPAAAAAPVTTPAEATVPAAAAAPVVAAVPTVAAAPAATAKGRRGRTKSKNLEKRARRANIKAKKNNPVGLQEAREATAAQTRAQEAAAAFSRNFSENPGR